MGDEPGFEIEDFEQRPLGIPVIVGGPILTAGDERTLKEKGVAAVFGPSGNIEQIIETVYGLVNAERSVFVT